MATSSTSDTTIADHARTSLLVPSLILVQVLLEIGNDPGSDPDLLYGVVRDGNTQALTLLLADPRVDPSNSRRNPIITAIESGYTEVLKILLADTRIDPSDDDNLALRTAVERHESYAPRA